MRVGSRPTRCICPLQNAYHSAWDFSPSPRANARASRNGRYFLKCEATRCLSRQRGWSVTAIIEICFAKSSMPANVHADGSTARQRGKFGQPQNFPPAFEPVLAVLSNMMTPHYIESTARQRYLAATVRYGLHFSPKRSSCSGSGIFLLPDAI